MTEHTAEKAASTDVDKSAADVAIKNPDSLKKTLPDAREAARRASLAIGAK